MKLAKLLTPALTASMLLTACKKAPVQQQATPTNAPLYVDSYMLPESQEVYALVLTLHATQPTTAQPSVPYDLQMLSDLTATNTALSNRVNSLSSRVQRLRSETNRLGQYSAGLLATNAALEQERNAYSGASNTLSSANLVLSAQNQDLAKVTNYLHGLVGSYQASSNALQSILGGYKSAESAHVAEKRDLMNKLIIQAERSAEQSIRAMRYEQTNTALQAELDSKNRYIKRLKQVIHRH